MILEWTDRQWDIAFERYEHWTKRPAPPRDLAGCGIVRYEWQRRKGSVMP